MTLGASETSAWAPIRTADAELHLAARLGGHVAEVETGRRADTGTPGTGVRK